MLRKVLLSLSVMPFVLLVPLLEINDTHVFNPLWPAHARLHEAWQLATNVGVAVLCLWLAWADNRVRTASFLGLLVTSGFLIAYVLRHCYGGSMRYTDGSELTVFALNSAVLVMVVATVSLVSVAWSATRGASR